MLAQFRRYPREGFSSDSFQRWGDAVKWPMGGSLPTGCQTATGKKSFMPNHLHHRLNRRDDNASDRDSWLSTQRPARNLNYGTGSSFNRQHVSDFTGAVMLITISDILAAFPQITPAKGQANPDGTVDGTVACIASPDMSRAGSLVFVNDDSQLAELCRPERAVEERPAAIVARQSAFDEIAGVGSSIALVCDNPRLAMARVRRCFDDYQGGRCGWSGIHPSAVIHPQAQVAPDCEIGPGAVIGKSTTIGAQTRIDAQCVIEHDVVIGERCHIHARVFIGYRCVLGDDVLIRPGTVVGGEGFGLEPNESGRFERVPHTGRVVIQDDVIIGANCNIDRGTFDDTLLEEGVRLDALVHIAHNVHIERDALLLAQSVVAGSSRIGQRAILSGQTGVIDHKTVADDVVLLHRAGVVRDIDKPGQYAGNPAIPLREYLRATGTAKQLDRLKQRIRELEQKIGEPDPGT